MTNKATNLNLIDLHRRHPGLTPSLGGVYSEAAAVCFSRFHQSPVPVVVSHNNQEENKVIEYPSPTPQMQNAHANEIDATECGAYGVSLVVLEDIKGLVAVRRAETQSGSDWYVMPQDADDDDLEKCIRLEVSGVSTGNSSVIKRRLQEKVDQTRRGASNLPAMAIVVGFQVREITFSELGEQE